MANLRTSDQTDNPAQAGFDHLMSQLNWAILEWCRFHTGRGPAMVEAFKQCRQMASAAFPVEALVYEAHTDKESSLISEKEVRYEKR